MSVVKSPLRPEIVCQGRLAYSKLYFIQHVLASCIFVAWITRLCFGPSCFNNVKSLDCKQTIQAFTDHYHNYDLITDCQDACYPQCGYFYIYVIFSVNVKIRYKYIIERHVFMQRYRLCSN